ncbi:MAG TPA: phosphatase PAP2 family protein [Gemmatimonadales bacterium]|jgi:membrane-associated phospholipid phosphatase|nr:phosphatase PAP2 family protein [Gemmatimonadales bacterium]
MIRAFPLLLGLVAAAPTLATAQTLDTIPELPAAPAPASDHVIRWYHGAIAAGGLSALMLLDHPVQRYAAHNDGPGANSVASTVRHFGQPEVYGTITAGLVATGLITGNHAITRSGGKLALSLALAAGATEAGKLALGRPRPSQSLDADAYSPFSGQVSFPSGHSAMAFALATSLSDDIHRPWATVGLYGMATAVGWSRINDNRHWLSDVAAGAIVGITSAKLASGQWRIFGLRAPSFITGPSGLGLGWHGQF